MAIISIILGILSIVLGIFCFIYPIAATTVLVWCLAAFFLIFGIATLISYLGTPYKSAGGIVLAILGLMIGVFLCVSLFTPGAAASLELIVMIIMLIFLFVDGIISIVQGFATPFYTTSVRVLSIVCGILMVILSVILFSNVIGATVFASAILGIFIAIGLIVAGVKLIVASSKIQKVEKVVDEVSDVINK